MRYGSLFTGAGNGVVPLQAAHAYRQLLARTVDA